MVKLLFLHFYPKYEDFERLKEDLSRLEAELSRIESHIRQVVANFKNEVVGRVKDVERKVRVIDRRLEDLRFGRVQQVKLRVLKREAYHKLINLAESGTLLRFMQNHEVSFEEFVNGMARELGYLRTDPSHEEIVDYRHYIDLDFQESKECTKQKSATYSNLTLTKTKSDNLQSG